MCVVIIACVIKIPVRFGEIAPSAITPGNIGETQHHPPLSCRTHPLRQCSFNRDVGHVSVCAARQFGTHLLWREADVSHVRMCRELRQNPESLHSYVPAKHQPALYDAAMNNNVEKVRPYNTRIIIEKDS
eukprot:963481-Pyramimonas_sp.AAC.2